MAGQPIDWDDYLARFHRASPGITEDVLARCAADGRDPYAWLTEDIAQGARMLDLGCGSGPARPAEATSWVGLDLSEAELRRAQAAGRHRLLLADATRLPVASDSVDVVTSSMALMLVHPIEEALGEIHRVLAEGGELRLLLPTSAPLRMVDRLHYLRLFWAARSTTKFPPTTMRSKARRTLESLGFTVLADERVRFGLPIEEASDADRFIDSWYLPTTSEARRGAARARARGMAPFEIGVPLRRVRAQRS